MSHKLRINEKKALQAIKSKVHDYYLRQQNQHNLDLDYLINDTIYHETKRLREEPGGPHKTKDKELYRKINKRLKDKSQQNYLEILDCLSSRYLKEIKGNFNPMVYRLATHFIPRSLGFWFNPFSPKRFILESNIRHVDNTIIIDGSVEHVQKLEKKGTLIYAPTHQSHLDSVLIGLVLFRSNLQPVSYGAGLNLFTNRLISFCSTIPDRFRVPPGKKRVWMSFSSRNSE